jgi:hypothetical protein
MMIREVRAYDGTKKKDGTKSRQKCHNGKSNQLLWNMQYPKPESLINDVVIARTKVTCTSNE